MTPTKKLKWVYDLYSLLGNDLSRDVITHLIIKERKLLRNDVDKNYEAILSQIIMRDIK